MIEQSGHPLDVIARETGFRDRHHMREVFMRGVGVPPQAVRREKRINARRAAVNRLWGKEADR
jgi:transcriptional regulator GlxA family with amidase domain